MRAIGIRGVAAADPLDEADAVVEALADIRVDPEGSRLRVTFSSPLDQSTWLRVAEGTSLTGPGSPPRAPAPLDPLFGQHPGALDLGRPADDRHVAKPGGRV
jgi:hypothetical protein